MRFHGRVVWLWCWLGVLVAGCSQSSGLNSASQAATLTLLSLAPTPVTPTPTLFLLHTPTLRASNMLVMTLAPTPLPLPIKPPECYETPVGSLYCLGVIHNRLFVPVEHVTVRVYLVSAEGLPLAHRDVEIARAALKPGEMSPYSAQFERIPEGSVGPVVEVVSAYRSLVANDALDVYDLIGNMHGQSFHVAGKLVNSSRKTLARFQVIVTLFDSHERVTGYRSVRVTPDNALSPGTAMPFEVDVIPVVGGTIRFEASAEGSSE